MTLSKPAGAAALAFALLSGAATAQESPTSVPPQPPAVTAPATPAAPTLDAAPAAPAAPAADIAPPAPVTDAGSAAPVATDSSPDSSAQPTTEAPAAADSAGAPEAVALGQPDVTPTAEQDVALAPVPAETLPHDLSPWGMFMAADWVVKGVMIGLAVASLLCWTILIVKAIEVGGAKRNVNRALKAINGAQTLDDALGVSGGRRDPAAFMLRAAHEEYHRSEAAIDEAGTDGVKERVGSLLSRIESQAGRRLSRGTGILATIGSIAPFVGLFGTVWGIMNSFIGISESQTTNLAVVAPGIAEALLATAIGLVAAIPAVVIYNMFARSITGYRALLGDAGAGIERLVSRDLDFRNLARIGLRSGVRRQAAE